MKRVLRWQTGVLVVACVAVLATGWAVTRPAAELEIRLDPADQDRVARGRHVYASHCADCHGAKLEGQPNWRQRDGEGYLPAPPHDETGHTWHHRDELLFEMTKRGIAEMVGGNYKTRMPAYRDVLSDEEILSALTFIKASWPEHIRLRHDRMNRPAAGQ